MYTKEKDSSWYTFIKGNEVLFKTQKIGLLTACGKVVKHGPFDKIKDEFLKIKNTMQISLVESDSFDINNLNKITADIPPFI